MVIHHAIIWQLTKFTWVFYTFAVFFLQLNFFMANGQENDGKRMNVQYWIGMYGRIFLCEFYTVLIRTQAHIQDFAKLWIQLLYTVYQIRRYFDI